MKMFWDMYGVFAMVLLLGAILRIDIIGIIIFGGCTFWASHKKNTPPTNNQDDES